MRLTCISFKINSSIIDLCIEQETKGLTSQIERHNKVIVQSGDVA